MPTFYSFGATIPSTLTMGNAHLLHKFLPLFAALPRQITQICDLPRQILSAAKIEAIQPGNRENLMVVRGGGVLKGRK